MRTVLHVCRGRLALGLLQGLKPWFLWVVALCVPHAATHARILYVDCGFGLEECTDSNDIGSDSIQADGSADRPFATIAEAIEDAQPKDTIRVRDGQYSEPSLVWDKCITLCSDSNDPATCTLICDAPGRVFHLQNSADESVIRGFTIRHGKGNPGPGILLDGCNSVMISNCVLLGMLTEEDDDERNGAGVCIRNSDNCCVVGCSFIDGTASGYGGGIYTNAEGMTVRDCSFIGNTTFAKEPEGAGGAIHLAKGASDSNTIDSVFFDNRARNGGAIGILGSDSCMRRCSFYANTAIERGGAVCGVASEHEESVSILACVFNQNNVTAHMDHGGGAVYWKADGNSVSPLRISNCSFAGNIADYGGALRYFRTSGAHDSGISVNHCSFCGNVATEIGGGIYVSGDLSLTNSILWGNHVFGHPAGAVGSQLVNPSEPNVLISYSNIQGSRDKTGKWLDALGDDGGGNKDADPLFAFDDDLHLAQGSPCIDAGVNAPSDSNDLDGRRRRTDGDGDGNATADMGAYEFDLDHPALAVSPRVLWLRGRQEERQIEPGLILLRGCGEEGAPDANAIWSFQDVATRATHSKGQDIESWLDVYEASPDQLDSWTIQVDPSKLSPDKQIALLTIVDANYPGDQSSVSRVVVRADLGRTLWVRPDEPNQAGLVYGTVADAVENAMDADTIILADHTYTGERNAGVVLHGNGITLRSEKGPASCIVDCEQRASTPGFLFQGRDSDFRLIGITIRDSAGQGIQCNKGSSPEIRDCCIKGCSTGVYLSDSSRARIIGTEFRANTAVSIDADTSSPSVFGCGFYSSCEDGASDGNGSAATDGRAINLVDCDNAQMLSCLFDGFTVSDANAAAIRVHTSPNTTIKDCSFIGCVAESAGAVEFYGSSGGWISNCMFTKNTSGALRVRECSPTIVRCSFLANTAKEGGALAITHKYPQPMLPITNCVFARNTADYGGGMWTDLNDSSVEVTNCTFYENTAETGEPNGHDIYHGQGDLLTLRNCILWSETEGQRRISSENDDANGLRCEYCDIRWCYQGRSSDPHFSAKDDWDPNLGQRGSGNIESDPEFYDAGEDDFTLAVTSPCIDRGRNVTGLFSDRRGSLRPINGDRQPPERTSNDMDMGAYEYSRWISDVLDRPVSAFSDVSLPLYGRVGTVCELRWENHSPFPLEDWRVTDPEQYSVELYLVSEDETRTVYLTDATVPHEMPTGEPYVEAFTFGPEHTGRWHLRVQMKADPEQYVTSDAACYIAGRQPAVFYVGKEIVRPADVEKSTKPTIQEQYEERFFWSDFADGGLYATGPVTGAYVTWTDTRGDDVPQLVTTRYPADAQIYLKGAPAVELLPEGSPYELVRVVHTQSGGAIQGDSRFVADRTGHSVILYGSDSHLECVPRFQVVVTKEWVDVNDVLDGVIGTEITDPSPLSVDGSDRGWVYHQHSPYDPNAYNREAVEGQIFPVNVDRPDYGEDDLVVFWYDVNDLFENEWPAYARTYQLAWPSSPEKIIIASEVGSEVYSQSPLDDSCVEARVYNQPDRGQPGYNPNEEHAELFPSKLAPANREAVFALRNDLNRTDWSSGHYTSEPYVLLKYRKRRAGRLNWEYRVFQVIPEEGVHRFSYYGEAGMRLYPPYPLSELPFSDLSYPDADPDVQKREFVEVTYPDPGSIKGPFFVDYRKAIWGRCEDQGTIRWFYPLQESYWYDLDGDGESDKPAGAPIPLLADASRPNTPVPVDYKVSWPVHPPELLTGETLLTAKRGLPDIIGQCSVSILYDQQAEDTAGGESLVRLYDPTSERRVDLSVLPEDLSTRMDARGNKIFIDLPFHLRVRCFYDPRGGQNGQLVFRGHYDSRPVGDPILLPNVMSRSDNEELLDHQAYYKSSSPVNRTAFQNAVRDLNDLTWQLFDSRLEARRLRSESMALSAGSSGGLGYVTLAFGADEPNCASSPSAGAGVSLEVIKISTDLYPGELKILESDNPFDERLTLRHSNDFGCRPEEWEFQWRYSEATENDEPVKPSDDPRPWKLWPIQSYERVPSDKGRVQITVQGDGVWALKDLWFSCRYGRGSNWSGWTEPQIHENWITRVTKAVNPFEQRVRDLFENEVHTQVDMIAQAGGPYLGPVALTMEPENIKKQGLIGIYSTMFERAREFSVDMSGNDPGANNALLLAATRIADLYMLLGNEAYADALDPTVGFLSDGVEYNAMAPSLFCFQNQVGSLIEEELALLRGLDQERREPLYNRLPWNIGYGGDGEVAYRLAYNISDQDETGDVDEYDAKVMYPQGHGDAWGHYLSATKTYYELIHHGSFTWVPNISTVALAQVPVGVDFMDERKFAEASAAKARTGAEIVDLTYRSSYTRDPVRRLQGYADTDPQRAWGVVEWGQRAGQAAFFDWVVGNAILPYRSEGASGIRKIDRETVVELREITACFADIQAQIDKSDQGLNPIGVAENAIPFDVDPEMLAPSGQTEPQTHFEQVYNRAVVAVVNAETAFSYANRHTQLLRRQQDTIEQFCNSIADREADFKSRLIEIFGYPYQDDLGRTYRSDYDGPDIYHFDYVDVSELLGVSPTTQEVFPVTLQELDVNSDGNLRKQDKTVEFHLAKDGLGLVKPASWTGRRRAPGELQFARSDLLQARARFQKVLVDYDNLLAQIEDQAVLLQAQYKLNSNEIHILNNVHSTQISLNEAIKSSRTRQLTFRSIGRTTMLMANALKEFFPTSVGFSTDVFAPVRGAIMLGAALINEGMTVAADLEAVGELSKQQAKEIVQSESNIELTTLRTAHAARQQLLQLEQMIRSEASMRLELFTLQEAMQQASGRYLAALARGLRLLEDRLRFRKQTAEAIQDYRYKDMAFRVFRNDALQKYRAQFDLAARYVCQAARVYDYETTLLDPDSVAGSRFLEKICQARMLGNVDQGRGINRSSGGLAGLLGELDFSFRQKKGQLGFNNPDKKTTYFSLRWERFRIPHVKSVNGQTWSDVNDVNDVWDNRKVILDNGREVLADDDPDKAWRQVLKACFVPDLWDLDGEYGQAFRRYCAPFANRDIEPAIVIPFSTCIESRKNFFGYRLMGDAWYPPENFATKIRSVGVWFSNFDTDPVSGMSTTPYVYLIPIGQDTLRVPGTSDFADVRQWQVFEQVIPVPSEIDERDLQLSEWLPMRDSLQQVLGTVRRHQRLQAYTDGGLFGTPETTSSTRLVGRSVWNTRWLLIIPGSSLWYDPEEGIQRFIGDADLVGPGSGVSDITLCLKTYSYSGY